MRILFIVPYAPTPIRTRPYHLLRGLTRRGHAVTLATLWENEDERAALGKLEAEGIQVLSARLAKARSAWNCLCALPTATPLQAVYCWQPELVERMKADQGKDAGWDVIHVEHLRGARYGLALKNSSMPHPSASRLPVVWDSVDCISYLFGQAAHNSTRPLNRLVTRFELGRTRRYEAWLPTQFDRVLVTSPIDKAALKELGLKYRPAEHAPRSEARRLLGSPLRSEVSSFKAGDGHMRAGCDQRPATMTVLPNGVDLDHFVPPDSPREPATLVFSGKMSYHANVTAATYLLSQVMPLLWRERPDVRVQIAGKDPPSSLYRQSAECGGRVTITGTVPDVLPYLQQATIAVAPMSYGAGIQNKVLEAMACATPVVATPQAVAALDARDGEDLLVADGAPAFARRVLSLLDDADLRNRIGRSGRRYVTACHDWNTITAELEAIYKETIASHRAVVSGVDL